MQQLFNYFYKQFGVKRIQNLISPRIFDFNDFPKNSMVHYSTHDDEHCDIDSSKMYFTNFDRKILVDYVEDLTSVKGVPLKKAIMIRNLIKDFHVKNKKFRFIKNPHKSINDQTALIVYNYNYIEKAYRYTTLPFNSYNKWWNLEQTRWDNINNICKENDRNHFIFINLTKNIPSFTHLKLFSSVTNLALLKIFDTSDKLFLLELWKWLGIETRSQSTLVNLSPEFFNRINIVFTIEDGKSTILNLGYINSWIKGSENVTEFPNVAQYDNLQVQKLFLKYLLTMNAMVTEESDILDNSVADVDPLKKDEDSVDYTDDDEGENETTIDSANTNLLNNAADVVNKEFVDSDDSNSGDDFEFVMKDIDEDLKALEVVNKAQLKQKGVHLDNKGELMDTPEEYVNEISEEEVNAKIYNNEDPDSSLIRQLNENAEYGLVSASDYKKLSKDISIYKNSKDPYGSDKLTGDKVLVTKDDIHISEEKTSIADSSLVMDKAMLSSSLQVFDKDYVNKVMQKDTLAMVHSLQKAGVIVKKHTIEEDHSVLGTYEHHTLELKPLDGVSSTIHFKLPKVNEDGTFCVSTSKYVMRKQRIDQPLRKISPNEVALTSYYGKTFVTRSTKKANSSLDWIVKNINKESMEEGSYISKIAPANVFDNNKKAPYIYNALSSHYRSFKAGNYNLVFDNKDEMSLGGNPDIKELKSKGYFITGYTDSSEPIVLDKNSNFFIFTKKTFIPIGDIYKILNLDQRSAPVDFSEINVFSKSIPVGIILGYHIGFKSLLKLLKVKYRTVEPRKQKNLEENEYSISFNDVTYVFNRSNQLASLILGGYLEFEKQTKIYPGKEFDNKNVYLNLLESKNLSSLYIREIDLSDKLFIDPITKSILEEMGEPLTLRGLMVRASEMLLYYHHPDPQDMNYMRIRGYERFPGVIYKQLSTAIRQYKNKNIAGRSKIDISPYQVWQNILKDPAIKLIEDINPIQNLKESEIVTYVGEGGRGKDSMNKASRAYHINDVGIISEATVDSGDVGVNAYLSANPNFENLRGLPSKNKTADSANLLSTSALLAPGSD